MKRNGKRKNQSKPVYALTDCLQSTYTLTAEFGVLLCILCYSLFNVQCFVFWSIVDSVRCSFFIFLFHSLRVSGKSLVHRIFVFFFFFRLNVLSHLVSFIRTADSIHLFYLFSVGFIFSPMVVSATCPMLLYFVVAQCSMLNINVVCKSMPRSFFQFFFNFLAICCQYTTYMQRRSYVVAAIVARTYLKMKF